MYTAGKVGRLTFTEIGSWKFVNAKLCVWRDWGELRKTSAWAACLLTEISIRGPYK